MRAKLDRGQWGAIGGFKAFKVNSVQVDSVLTRNIRWVQDKLKLRKMTYAFYLFVYKNSLLYGAISKWPKEKLRCVTSEKAMKAKHVKEVELPDDDGVTYHDLNPIKTKLDKLQVVRIKGDFGWTEVLVPIPKDEPF